MSRRAARRGRSGGVPIFTPRSLSGLVAWYRADLGITIATGVSAWNNIVTGDANTNLAQGTAGNQPTFTAADAAYNNQPTLTFDGVNDSLLSGTWAAAVSQPFSWFVVGNDGGTAAAQEFLEGNISGSNRSILGGGTLTSTIYSTYSGSELGSGPRSNAKRVIGGINNGASSSFFMNAKTATATGTVGATGNISALIAGSSFAASAFLVGKIAEIVIVNRAITQGEVNNLLTYLGARYAITIGA